MNTKTITHTPGPWKIRITESRPNHASGNLKGFIITEGDDGAEIARVCPMPHPVHVNPANVALIASSPEMLDALKLAHDALSYTQGVGGEIPQAIADAAFRSIQAVISKVEAR